MRACGGLSDDDYGLLCQPGCRPAPTRAASARVLGTAVPDHATVAQTAINTLKSLPTRTRGDAHEMGQDCTRLRGQCGVLFDTLRHAIKSEFIYRGRHFVVGEEFAHRDCVVSEGVGA